MSTESVLKGLLGDQYQEGMTLEQVEEALAGREIVDKATLPKSVKKELFDKTASDLADAKKRVKELEERVKELEDAQLTDEQRVQRELEKRDEQIAELHRNAMKLSAREKLAKAGYESDEFVDALVGQLSVDDPKPPKLSDLTITDQMKLKATDPERYRALTEKT
jgi:predicted oxidoreductase